MMYSILILMSDIALGTATATATTTTVSSTIGVRTSTFAASLRTGSTASFVSARQSTRSSPTDYLKISTRLDVSTIRATTSEFGDGGTTSTAARFSTNAIATNSIVPFIITTSSLAFNSLEMSPSISVSTLRGPAGSGTSSVAQLTTPSLSSPFGNYTTLLVVVGIAGMFLILLLIAIAIIILLVAKKRRNSGKLVLQHGLQDLCSPGISNKTLDKSSTSIPHNNILSPKTSRNIAYVETSYQSKSMSMESLGCSSENDEVSTMQDIVVPTQGQRRCIAENIIKGSSRHLYTILRNQQKSLVNVMANGKDENYWRPSNAYEYLYQQLFENKYLEIPRNKIKILSYLRSETFGIVHKGLWHSSTGLKEVAARLLHEDASIEEEVLFLQEAAIIGQFSNHPNVVQLYGLATLKNPKLIITEFLEYDIKSYLTTQRTTPDASCLLSFCQQVASGMKFLSDRKFVHRNIMAQTIFLTEHRICKIGGFETSLLLENEQLRISYGISIATRWVAPEVIHSKMYSSSSDVWSYGVLMYEIWSKATHIPYEQLTDQQVAKAVDDGTRLKQPPGCPQAVYIIMTECWDLNPASRPPFGTICTRLWDNLLLGDDDSITPVSRF